MKALLVALLGLLLLPSSAAAVAFPGERPADPQVIEEVGVAVGYWSARGVTGCPAGITAMVADDLSAADGVAAAGRGIDCRIWLRASDVAWFRGPGSWRYRRAGAEQECTLVVHEVGHALGLPHATRGVMSPLVHAETRECLRWSHARIHRPPRIACRHGCGNIAQRAGRLRGGHLQGPRGT